MGRAVLLKHTIPDGSWHYDWLVERAPGAALMAFRVRDWIDGALGPGFEAEAMPDHRRDYLDYEGEVSGGRGRVERVAIGEMRIAADGFERVVIEGSLGAVRGRFEGRRIEDDRWWFEFAAW
ncbi:MAG: hypothetical protein JNM80_09850 [Phycisphaerae bacterium]|nr:hypothetical protein [Phycisphaerae bacterium]